MTNILSIKNRQAKQTSKEIKDGIDDIFAYHEDLCLTKEDFYNAVIKMIDEKFLFIS